MAQRRFQWPTAVALTRRSGLRGASRLLPWLLAVGLLSWAAPGLAGQPLGPVRPGQTLWQIAGQLQKDTGLTRDQLMLALLWANPEAFSIPCNVNGDLKLGAILRVPALDQMALPDAQAARTEIAEQNRRWRRHLARGGRLECPTVVPGAHGAGRPAQPERPPTGTTVPVPPSRAPEEVPQPTPAPAPAVEQTPCPQPQPSEAVQCTCPKAASTPTPVPAAPVHSATQPGHFKPRQGRLAPGPRAPGWLLVPLVLVLSSAALIRWERRQIAAALRSPETTLQAVARLPLRALTSLSPTRREVRLLLPLAAVAGMLGAFVTVLFREGIHALEWLLGGRSDSLVELSISLPRWERFLLPAAGGLVAGLVLQGIGGWLRGIKTTDYIEAIAVGDGRIGIRQSLVKAVSSLCTVASGGSIGREGAMVQLSAMVASTLGRICSFERDPRRLLVAAGAAAGLASAYNAPIAATIFVAEIVLGSIAIDFIGPLIVAAVIANITVHDILGYAPVYRIPEFQLVSDWELGLYFVLGLLAGHVAPAFLSLLQRAHGFFRGLPMPLFGRLGLGGLIVGAISVYEPQVWGNGYSVVNSVLVNPWVWQSLLTVLVLKMLATAATHGSGAVGGAFTPTLFVGALLGALFGTLVQMVLPVGTAPPNAYAVVGMGAMLAGTTHAPLMSILMVFEMTMDYQIVLPLMLAVIVAHNTSRRYRDIRPMYAESLLPRETE
jgi:FimV-like protein